MARPKSPDSRSVTLATRVSEATAGVIDVKRGPATRSEWLERLISGDLADERWRHERGSVLCHHRACHKLSCDEYDALRMRAAGRCEICGTPEEETTRRLLVIDHYEDSSTWYVRGLLCDPCNTGVMACFDGKKPWGENRKWEQKAAEYAAKSWQSPSAAPRGRKAIMTFRTDADLYAAVAALAGRLGETVTDVITRGFEAYVAGDSTPVAVMAPVPVEPPPPDDEPARPACRHPSGSVIDGVCRECGEEVWLP